MAQKTKYVSKGERKSSMSTRNTDLAQRLVNQRAAFDSGKNTMVTIENPNREETNKPFIRVSGKQVFKPAHAPESEKKRGLSNA